MISGRFFILVICLFICWGSPASNASAFWGFGDEDGKSGLDFEAGYDLNTEATVKGKVISVESSEGSGPVTILLRRGNDIIHAVAGPKWYWFDRGINIKQDDELRVVGAKAQGKDGKMYIIAREISNLSNGEEVNLRDNNGRPVWKGGGRTGRGGGGGMQRGFGGGRRGR